MIKANELRVGNLVYDFIKGETRVETIEDYDFPDRAMLERIQPIPLTEEWLEGFGFKFDENDGEDIYYGNGLYIYIGNKSLYSYVCTLYGKSHKVHFEHVHQLQNLYFALTGEELELKDK